MGESVCFRKNETREMVEIDHPQKLNPVKISCYTVAIIQGWVFQAFDITAACLSEAYIATLAKITGNIMDDLSTKLST